MNNAAIIPVNFLTLQFISQKKYPNFFKKSYPFSSFHVILADTLTAVERLCFSLATEGAGAFLERVERAGDTSDSD